MYRFLNQFIKLLLDPRVSSTKKLLFLALISVYWVLPDLLPFIPLDDILVTLLGSWAFVKSAGDSINKEEKEKKSNGKVIDVKGEIIEEDDE